MIRTHSFLVFILMFAAWLQFLAAQSERLEPPPGQRCSGRNYQGRRCCTPENPCGEGEGDCDGPGDGGQHDGHEGCKGSLVCGSNNCKTFGAYYHEKDDCCEKKPLTYTIPIANRCAGRNIDMGKCCTVNVPCDEGEGDCEDDDECGDDLVCGDNNCNHFAAFFHPKDDCCLKAGVRKSPPSTTFEWGEWISWSASESGKMSRTRMQISVQKNQRPSKNNLSDGKLNPNIPLEPPAGQRCSGRNYQGRRCCTPENPCDEGEGDCDGPGDGGQHDGHEGCKGNLVCGSNNCKQFGQYYHDKDDCCEAM